MPSEQEEIMSELSEEGVTAEAPAEAPAEEPAAEEQPELELGSAGDEEEAPAEPEEPAEPAAPEPVAAAPQPDPRDDALRVLREEMAQMRADLARAQAPAARTPDPQRSADDELLARDPLTLSPTEYLRYVNLRNERSIEERFRQRELRAEALGRMAASETAARGLLSAGAVGQGFDYDTIAEPVRQQEAVNPGLAQVIQSSEDQALSRYTLGLVLAIQEKAKGDPVAAVKLIRQALTGEARGSAKAITKIQEAAKRNADRVKNGAGGVGGRRGKITDRDVESWDDATFDKFEREQGIH
jgi:hypothetical protein